jgi:hypothetical protein
VAEAQGHLDVDLAARGGSAHENADVDGRRIWQTAAALAATIAGAVVAAYGGLALLHHETGRALAPTNATPAAMPSPPLQGAPARDLAAFRAQKQALLAQYAWIDRDKGIVRIPIERAMALLVARAQGKAR